MICIDETLYGLQVHINDQSIPNTPVFVVLYEDNPSGDPLYLTQSDDYYLTSIDLGNWITIPFDGGYDLYSGTGYVIYWWIYESSRYIFSKCFW